VLIIHKPKGFDSPLGFDAKLRQNLQSATISRAYYRNLIALRRYKQTDTTVRQLLKSKSAAPEDISISPQKATFHVQIAQGETKILRLKYDNNSKVPLLSVATELTAKPVVLATSEPLNRDSKFKDPSWLQANRPTAQLHTSKTNESVEYIEPAKDFSFELVLNSRGVRKGEYTEEFSVVQELVGWVPNSAVRVHIKVV
jgi:hypothetical protein